MIIGLRKYIKLGREAMKLGKFPWKLSNDIIKKQYEANEQFRAQTNLEMILREIWDFDLFVHKKSINYDDIKSVQTDKRLHRQNYPDLSFSVAEARHTLKRLCSIYTGTVEKPIQLKNCEGKITDGVLKQGQHTRYIMPPRLTDFE